MLELDDDFGLHYLWAPDVASACPDLDLSQETGATEAVACFFSARPALLERGGEDTRIPPWQVSEARVLPEDGSALVRVRQTHEGLRVRGGEIVLIFRNGRLRSVLGHLFPPSAFPAPRTAEPEALPTGASPAPVPNWTEVDRYFDVEAGQPVVEILDEDSQVRIGLGMADGRIVREVETADRQTLSPRSKPCRPRIRSRRRNSCCMREVDGKHAHRGTYSKAEIV